VRWSNQWFLWSSSKLASQCSRCAAATIAVLTATWRQGNLWHFGPAEMMQRSLLVPGTGWADGAAELAAALDAAERTTRDAAVAACEKNCLDEMEAAVDGPGWAVIEKLRTDLWTQLRALMKQALKHGIALADAELEGYGCASTALSIDPSLRFSVTSLHKTHPALALWIFSAP
jgi:hypothetical protein